jgi:dihydroorotase-like cyclic amidohydrolase
MMDTLVIKGPAYTAGKVQQAVVRIERGTIVAVSANDDLGKDARVITLGPRQVLLPAAIDTLCAMRDWGEAPRDTVEAVSKGALAGGITVVCDQPNTVPRINTPELIRQRAQFVAERSYTDFGISAHPPLEPHRIEEYRDAGAFSVSVFMWDLRPWNYPRDTDDSAASFRRYAQLGLKGLVFPEELALRETSLEEQGETYALEALLRRLDPEWEVRVFATLPDSVDRMLAARARLPRLLVQVATHALFMSREEGFQRIGIGASHSPPLRSAADTQKLKRYAEEGQVDIVVSHHSPHRMCDKYNTESIPGEFTPKRGYSVIDYAYPLCLTKLGIEHACRTFCENPARHLGLKKGLIASGYEADLAVIEESAGVAEQNIHQSGAITQGVWRIDPATFQSLGKVTPFVGERLKYRVLKTLLRGAEVYDAATATFRRVPVRRIA